MNYNRWYWISQDGRKERHICFQHGVRDEVYDYHTLIIVRKRQSSRITAFFLPKNSSQRSIVKYYPIFSFLAHSYTSSTSYRNPLKYHPSEVRQEGQP